jgi:hypothetical protein
MLTRQSRRNRKRCIWCHCLPYQHAEDNPAFASIHHIMGLVAKMCPAPFETQWRGVGIRGAAANVCRA